MVGNPAYTINHLAIYLDLAEGVNCIEVSTALENGDGLPHSWLRMFEIYKTYTYNCFWTVCWLFQISCQYSWLSIEIWLIGWSVCDILLKSDVSCLIALRLLTILCNEITSPRTLVAIRGLAGYNLAHASKEDCWLFEIWIGNCPRRRLLTIWNLNWKLPKMLLMPPECRGTCAPILTASDTGLETYPSTRPRFQSPWWPSESGDNGPVPSESLRHRCCRS